MSLENLKLITNYKEKDLSKSDTYNLPYVESVSFDDDEYLRELKAKRREVAIDVFLGEREDSELEDIKSTHNKWQGNTGGIQIVGTFSVIAPSIYTVSGKVQKFSDYNDIYENLLHFIDNKTNCQKKLNRVGSLDLILKKYDNLTDSENFDTFCRKVMTRLTMCSNIISMEGRIGTGTFVLVGKDNWNYFHSIENNNSGLNIIYTDKIEKDKVIVGRRNNPDQSGISLFMDIENKKYIRFETNLWEKQYCWFKIIKNNL
jgi:hypothetical protein